MRGDYNNGIWTILAIFVFEFDAVFGRECYNLKEDPKVRDCPNGCCGEDYAQYCCDATLQIVGCAIGGALVLGAIISAVYCCYRKKKSKRRMAQGGGQSRTFVTRFGFRTRPANNDRGADGPRLRPRVQPQHGVPPTNIVTLNPSYRPPLPGQYGPVYNIPAGQGLAPPMNPTAPMPPPYSMTIAPPPYSDAKPIPPPPEYQSVVHGTPPKIRDYTDSMPPPSN